MALGKPAITDPRPPAPRDVTQAVSNIRQRIEALEAALSTLSAAGFDDSAIRRQISQLRSDLSAVAARVSTLEGEVPTDWYVDGVLIGTRHRANFIHGAGMVITGEDDSVNERVNITFGITGVDLNMPVSPAALRINGRDIAMSVGKFITTTQAQLIIAGRSVGMSLSTFVNLDVDRTTLHVAGRDVGMSLTSNTQLVVARTPLIVAGRDIIFARGISVGRTALRTAGRNLGISTASLALPVSAGRILTAGRTVAMDVTSLFTRNWNDNLTTNQTLFGGTGASQSASGGQFHLSVTTNEMALSRMDAVASFLNGYVEITFTAPATGFAGFAYRTTNWGVNDGSYGWVCYYTASTDNIGFGYGSNSNPGSFTNRANAGSGVAAGNPVTLRVEFSGQTHNVFVNGSQKMNRTGETQYDSTAGQVGIYVWGSSLTVDFDNMTISDH